MEKFLMTLKISKIIIIEVAWHTWNEIKYNSKDAPQDPRCMMIYNFAYFIVQNLPKFTNDSCIIEFKYIIDIMSLINLAIISQNFCSPICNPFTSPLITQTCELKFNLFTIDRDTFSSSLFDLLFQGGSENPQQLIEYVQFVLNKLFEPSFVTTVMTMASQEDIQYILSNAHDSENTVAKEFKIMATMITEKQEFIEEPIIQKDTTNKNVSIIDTKSEPESKILKNGTVEMEDLLKQFSIIHKMMDKYGYVQCSESTVMLTGDYVYSQLFE